MARKEIRYRGPLIAGFYVCRDCGCVVQGRTMHDLWHELQNNLPKSDAKEN